MHRPISQHIPWGMKKEEQGQVCITPSGLTKAPCQLEGAGLKVSELRERNGASEFLGASFNPTSKFFENLN